MKCRYVWLTLVIVLLVFVQCRKRYWQQNYQGNITATLNGEKWESVIIAKEGDKEKLWFLIDVYENERWIEGLSLSKIPAEEGLYSLHISSYNNEEPGARYTIGHQDVIYSSFFLDTTYHSNYLQIDKLNTFWNKVKGSFEVRLIKDGTANAPRTDKNTVHIVCEEFSTSIH